MASPAGLGDPARIAFPIQQGRRRRRKGGANRRGAEAGRIARHYEVAAGAIGVGRADGILEVGPAKGQSALQDLPVDGGHSEDRERMSDTAARCGGAPCPREEVEECCDAVGWHEA
jgi:hypothetical protein